MSNRIIEQVELRDKPRVRLVGEDGNAYSIMGRVISAWKKSNHPQKYEIVEQYILEAKSNDYHHLLNITREYIREDTSLYYLYEKENDEEENLEKAFVNRLIAEMYDWMKY